MILVFYFLSIYLLTYTYIGAACGNLISKLKSKSRLLHYYYDSESRFFCAALKHYYSTSYLLLNDYFFAII